MATSTLALLSIALTNEGRQLITNVVTNLVTGATPAVFDHRGNNVTIANMWQNDTVVCYLTPINPKLQPTCNVTAAQHAGVPGIDAVFASPATSVYGWNADQLGRRKIGTHIMLAVHRLLSFGAAGLAEIQRLIAHPDETDCSHLYQPCDIASPPGWTRGNIRAAECCFEAHDINMQRIACRVFALRFGGGCICSAGIAPNQFQPACKSLPGILRALVNGIMR